MAGNPDSFLSRTTSVFQLNVKKTMQKRFKSKPVTKLVNTVCANHEWDTKGFLFRVTEATIRRVCGGTGRNYNWHYYQFLQCKKKETKFREDRFLCCRVKSWLFSFETWTSKKISEAKLVQMEIVLFRIFSLNPTDGQPNIMKSSNIPYRE